MNHRLAVLLLSASVVVGSAIAQTTRLVPSQYPTIQAAINACINGDDVLVAPGTYSGGVNFLGKAITVHSSGGAVVTTIQGSAGTFVVTFGANESLFAILDGFTITGGAGVIVQNSSPTIQNCRILNNVRTAGPGGGILCSATGSGAASPHITSCAITSNFNINGNNASGGAGLAFDGTSTTTSFPVVSNCAISSNVTTANSLGAPGEGGGIAISGKWNVTFTGCSIIDNMTLDYGGACFIAAGSASFTSCRILGNHGQFGGAVYLSNGSVSLTSCLIAGNLSDHWGGFLYSNTSGSAPQQTIAIKNCTIVANVAAQSIGGLSLSGVNLPFSTVSSSILWGNSGTDIEAPTALVSYSDVELGLYGAGPGNVSTDPRFVNPALGDFHLATTSPCRNAGDPGTIGLPPFDLDGGPRIVAGVVDMGSDEVPAIALPGTPDGLDLYAVINGGGDPLASTRAATPGDLLSVTMKSSTGSLVGGLPLFAARLYFTGNSFAVPGGGIWMDSQSVIVYGTLSAPPFGFPGLPAGGLAFSFLVPPGLSGQTVRMQGLVTAATALNGMFATTNATEATF
jgi:hypothetical protein